jgi:Mu-like prophage I protein
VLESILTQAPVQQFEKAPGSNQIWVEALPARTYKTQQYGEVPISPDTLGRMAQNFKNNVRGQEVAIDFEHGLDRAKGNKAAGWYKDVRIGPSSSDSNVMSLYALVDFTEEAKKEIQDEQWKYFSLEWDDLWHDNDGTAFEDVIVGGGLTNRPIAKRTLPINFSESMLEDMTDEERKTFAVWTTAYVNDLPNSAFLYVEPGSKDSEGKTVPRSKRHLPYKSKEGKIDLPHLRNAIARIPQMKGISAELKARLQARARKLLSSAGGKPAMSEEVANAFDLLVAEGFDVTDESKEWEHSEPGTGQPPEPRKDEDGSDDPAIEGGWRRDFPPGVLDDEIESSWRDETGEFVKFKGNGKRGGKEVPSEFVFGEKQARQLFRVLEIDVDGEVDIEKLKDEEVVEAARLKFGELSELKSRRDLAAQQKEFSEKYPDLWSEHNALVERDRANTAKAFSDRVSKIRTVKGQGLVDTKQGLSTMALEKVQEVHKKFSEGTATIEDFEDCIKTIVNGGIFNFGEIGSSSSEDIPEVDTGSATGIAQARKIFSEIMKKNMEENPDWGPEKALEEASKKHPDLAEAYKVSLPG